MFLHLPINHPLRGLYRSLGALAGLYVLVFGIVGLTVSSGHAAFGRGPYVALGLHTNVAFSVLSILVGLVVLVAAVVGRNVAQYVFLFGGLVFLGAGMAMLALMQTGLNVLNYTVATCVVSFLIGLVMVTSGLYTRTGPPAQAKAVDEHRHAPPARPARQAGATA
ncbi:MAG: hypothetical protein AUG44_09115 [Actinobacteria bacterium 13_1_20CM_3_71_11]|nr:MAG: hypothetical protein AUG44_09115 [Actinobacteria bacterium 13_1_20CM_3_71_11]